MRNKERMQHAREPLTDPIALFNEVADKFRTDPLLRQEFSHSGFVYLSRLTDAELQCLKKMTEMTVRREKDKLANNVLLKITAPLGVAYTVLRGSTEIFKDAEGLSQISDLLSTAWPRWLLDLLLSSFIIGCVLSVLWYLFFWVPGLQSAQRLNDAVLVALQERLLNSSRNSKAAIQESL